MSENYIDLEKENADILKGKNLKILIVSHILIWLIFSVKNGILWYYLYPDEIGLIIKYKLFEFIVIGGSSSFIILYLFKLINKYSKNNVHLLLGYLGSVFISISFYSIVTGISLSSIILSKFRWFSLESYLKGLTFYLFLFILLNLPTYLLKFWLKYRTQIFANRKLILTQRRNEEQERKEVADKVFLSNRHLPNYLELSLIKYIQADAYISHIFTTEDKKITLDRSLKKWEEDLPKKKFSRIHKSIIVNTEYINKIEKMPNQTYQIHIKESDTVLNMSRRYGKSFISNPQYQHLF